MKLLSDIVKLSGCGEDVLGSFTEQQVGKIDTQFLCGVQSRRRYAVGRDSDMSALFCAVMHLKKKEKHKIKIMDNFKMCKSSAF